jgi:hypothetical protein
LAFIIESLTDGRISRGSVLEVVECRFPVSNLLKQRLSKLVRKASLTKDDEFSHEQTTLDVPTTASAKSDNFRSKLLT